LTGTPYQEKYCLQGNQHEGTCCEVDLTVEDIFISLS